MVCTVTLHVTVRPLVLGEKENREMEREWLLIVFGIGQCRPIVQLSSLFIYIRDVKIGHDVQQKMSKLKSNNNSFLLQV
jgi:hypothetical protein